MGLLEIVVLFLVVYVLCMLIGGLVLSVAVGVLIDILWKIWRFFKTIVNKIGAFFKQKFGRF